jgi:hypothetical protein
MLPSETEAQHFENSFEILNYICNYMDGWDENGSAYPT